MLDSSSSTTSNYFNPSTKDNSFEIIETVKFCRDDELHQIFNKKIAQNDICTVPSVSKCTPCDNIVQNDKCAPPPVVKCDPCAGTKSVSSSWEWFGLFVLWFIALTVLFWLVYYSLKPPIVLQSDGNQVDTAKVLLAAVISAFVLIVIIWLIKAAMGK